MDTPVVVIGGSLTFKQGSKGGTAWTEVPGQPGQYQTVAPNPVSTIAIKTTAQPDSDDNHRKDDADPTTDKLPGLSVAGTSFQINVFTVASGANPIVSIASIDGITITLFLPSSAPSGAILCPNTSNRRVDYSSDGNCANLDQFAKVDVIIGRPPSTTTTTIKCILDATVSFPTPCLGKCRIVLRCPDKAQ